MERDNESVQLICDYASLTNTSKKYFKLSYDYKLVWNTS
jgi:hypothetical protein